MESLIEEFNLLYPNYSASPIKDNFEVVEPAPNSEFDFKRLVVSGVSGYAFPRQFAAESVAFYGKSGSPNPMRYNSDGLFFSETEGRKCLFVCELKSSFDATNITHAKEQIIGTILRLKAQMSILQSNSDWEYHGVIVSFEPEDPKLVLLNKLTSNDAKFAKYLYTKRHRLIVSNVAAQYYKPLSLPDVNIHYVAVPNRQTEYQVDIQTLLSL